MSDMDWNNGHGLPRSFVDDPFFQQHHHQRNSPSADFFRDFPAGQSGGPARRFSSNPRIFNDGGPPSPRFFDDFDRSGFDSLPRRSNSQSRSPRPPSAVERPIHVQRQGAAPFPTSPQPPRKANNENSKPPPAVHLNSQPAVEINNATSNYSNGRLNPDRAAADAAIAEGQSLHGSDTSEHSAERVRQPSGETHSSSGAENANPMNASNGSQQNGDGAPNAEARRQNFDRKTTSIDGRGGDQMISLLDETERRVEEMRERAAKLEIEKEQILDILGNVKLNSDLLPLGEGEREDINLTADRILKRCKAVEVVVNTPRSEEQMRALDEVNSLIQNVVQKMQDDLDSSKDTVQRFLNACSPDEPTGPIDQRFQSKVVECTADDQKKIRRRLAQMITQITRAEAACVPNF
ncbi:BAG family molecular chaperone regulator 2 [Aphelenchoides fujianensis]|nr:BAG family molecular chaperone regulator 2 [Aphelenchoides fujianensis]